MCSPSAVTKHMTLTQQCWRQDLRCRRITSLEQSAAQSQTMSLSFQTVTEDVFSQTARPRCSVNCFNYIRSIFTYLLTYLPVKSINTGRAEFCDVCVAIDTVCSPYPSLNLKWLRFSSCCCTDLKQSSSAYHICSVAWRRTSSNSVTCNYTWRRLHSCWRTETTCWWS